MTVLLHITIHNSDIFSFDEKTLKQYSRQYLYYQVNLHMHVYSS